MNKSIWTKIGFMLGAALVVALSGCVGHGDGSRHGRAYSQPSPDYYEGGASLRDDYVYYPGYQVYYSSNRGHYIYQDRGTWVTERVPPLVSRGVLATAPSVRLDFHDSPANHHATVVRKYPKNWTPSGNSPKEAKGNRDITPSSALGGGR